MPQQFSEFAQQCTYEGVSIDPRLTTDSWYSSPCHQPNSWYRAIAVAGTLLRKDPEIELIDKEVPEALIDSDNIAQFTLRGMLNASHTRLASAEPGTTFFCRQAKRLDCCSYAEASFSATLDNMQTPAKSMVICGDPVGWTILENKGEPVGITKTLGERSTVSLVPYVVNGIPYPAGSLFRTDTARPTQRIAAERLVEPSIALSHVGFLRLSAYAASPMVRRKSFAEAIGDVEHEPIRPLKFWTIEKIRMVAEKALADITCRAV